MEIFTAMFVSRQCVWRVQVGVAYSETLDWFATQRRKKQVIHDFNFWTKWLEARKTEIDKTQNHHDKKVYIKILDIN